MADIQMYYKNGFEYDQLNPKTKANLVSSSAVTGQDNVEDALTTLKQDIDSKRPLNSIQIQLNASDWEAEQNFYYQTITISNRGLNDTSTVFADCALSLSDIEADVEVLKSWGLINNATADTDTLTFYAYEDVPNLNIPVNVVIQEPEYVDIVVESLVQGLYPNIMYNGEIKLNNFRAKCGENIVCNFLGSTVNSLSINNDYIYYQYGSEIRYDFCVPYKNVTITLREGVQENNDAFIIITY